MAGIIIPVFGKRTFDFGNVGGGTSVEYVMVKSLELSQWTAVSLWVRVHSRNIGSGAEIEIIANPTAPCVEDPAVDFVESGTSVSLSVDGSTPSPGLLGVNMSFVSNPGVRISVKGQQGPSSPVALSAVLSVELVAKAKN